MTVGSTDNDSRLRVAFNDKLDTNEVRNFLLSKNFAHNGAVITYKRIISQKKLTDGKIHLTEYLVQL